MFVDLTVTASSEQLSEFETLSRREDSGEATAADLDRLRSLRVQLAELVLVAWERRNG